MILNNVKMISNDQPVNILVKDGKIVNISSRPFHDPGERVQLAFDNAMIFPGLINSHDHLDFNLFPQLGDKIYNNYTEWGKYIHENFADEIAGVLKIPAALRSRWGVFKNLLCGVTTVVNHGVKSGMKNDPITVFEQFQCLHSVQFEKRWNVKLNNPLKNKLPVVIHVGEGSDCSSSLEIDRLIRWNYLRRRLIGIHGVAMSESQATKFDALIWCPQSNYFLLNKTAQVNLLAKQTKILFGTDSTLTSQWNIWEHLQLARKTQLLSDDALYRSVNETAANAWQLNSGQIAAGRDADLVVANTNGGNTGFDAFFALSPADILLVMHKGNISLLDEILHTGLKGIDLTGFTKIYINGACKYVQGDLPGLMQKIREYQPGVQFPVSAAKLPAANPGENKFFSTAIDTF